MLTAVAGGLAAIGADGRGKNTFAGGFELVGWTDVVGTSTTGVVVTP